MAKCRFWSSQSQKTAIETVTYLYVSCSQSVSNLVWYVSIVETESEGLSLYVILYTL